MKKLFLIVLTLFLTANFALCTTTSYDKNGQTTGFAVLTFVEDLSELTYRVINDV